jgi:RNA polymerase sigma factor (sigma-70 family)
MVTDEEVDQPLPDVVAEGSFEAFYRSTKDPCLRAVMVTVGDRSAGEDVTAEAFALAYERWGELCDHPNPAGWVVRTALNVARHGWRRDRRRRPGTEGVQPAAAMPDQQLIDAVLALPRRQREVVAHRVLLDQSTAQTAASLGMAEGTVSAHLHRALSSLRTVLRDATEQEDS